MATCKTLLEAKEEDYLVLFDTNVLIDAFRAKAGANAHALKVAELMQRVERPRRFTSELVKWEFLHPKNGLSHMEMTRRRQWLDMQSIKVRLEYLSGYLKTLGALTVNLKARGGAVDGALAAYSISTRRAVDAFAVATGDGDDFCWHKDIVVISEFFRSPSDCQ